MRATWKCYQGRRAGTGLQCWLSMLSPYRFLSLLLPPSHTFTLPPPVIYHSFDEALPPQKNVVIIDLHQCLLGCASDNIMAEVSNTIYNCTSTLYIYFSSWNFKLYKYFFIEIYNCICVQVNTRLFY